MNPVHQHPTFAAAAHRLPYASAAGKSEVEFLSLPGKLHAAAFQQCGQLLTALRWEIKVLLDVYKRQGYELAPLDGSRSEVLTESITFAITGMKRTTQPGT